MGAHTGMRNRMALGPSKCNGSGVKETMMNTREERSDALEQVLGDLSVPLCELKALSKADIEKQLNYWKGEDDTLKEESEFNRMKELVWDGLQEHIIDLTEEEEEEANE